MSTSFVAVCCYQTSPATGAAKLARAVLRAINKVVPEHQVAVFLDEALGEDGAIFSTIPFLPTEHAICVLSGEQAECMAVTREMVRASRKSVFWKGIDTAPESLRLQAVFAGGRGVVSEESPYFDAKLLARATMPIERLPGGLPLLA